MAQSESHPPITVIVPCFNNAAYIEACLQSVAWADEVLLVDSFSSDGTLEIARPYISRVLQHAYENSARQKNWAIPQAKHDWVFVVDTDEQVTPHLRREVEAAVSRDSGFTGYRMPRKNIVFGRWLRHGGYWPDYGIRLFRKQRGRYQARQVHADILLEGPCGTLTSPLTHYPHRSLKVIKRTLLQRYTSWEALQKFEEGTRFRWSHLAVRPAGAFLVRNFVKAGYRDGWQGWLMSGVWGLYVFITYWKLRALTAKEGDVGARPEEFTQDRATKPSTHRSS